MKTVLSYKDVSTETYNEGNFFVGIEAEGKYRGIKTLFIKNFNNVSLDEIMNKINISNVFHIYIGAGESLITDFSKLRELTNLTKSLISCEIQSTEFGKLNLFPDVHFILNLPENIDVSLKTLKLTEKQIFIVDKLGNSYVTNFDDPLFSQDKKI